MGTQFEITIADQVTNMSIGTNGVDSTVLLVCSHVTFCRNDGQWNNLYTIFLRLYVVVTR